MSVTRIATEGSMWELDDDLMRYRRMPKMEQPRARPEWGDESAGALEDFVWHPMIHWRILDHDYVTWSEARGEHVRVPAGTLVIDTGGTGLWIAAPDARVVS